MMKLCAKVPFVTSMPEMVLLSHKNGLQTYPPATATRPGSNL